MKILQVIHDYLPHHRAGSEIYTHHLSKALIRRGHDVSVLFAEYRPNERQYSVRRGEHDGVPFHEVVWNYQYKMFEETYLNPEMDLVFERLLDDVSPQVLHVQHLQHFSLNFIRLARARGIPVVYTLHEYCLTCPRNGVRMMTDLSLCETLDSARCARCIGHEAVPPLDPSRFSGLETRLLARLHPQAWRAVRMGLATLGLIEGHPRPGEHAQSTDRDTRPHAAAIERRWEAVRRTFRDVDLFISPSPFLRTKFIEFGMEPDRILYSDYGLDLEPFEQLRRTESKRVRFGYVGTLAEHKGVHVLVEAMNRLPEGRASLEIHGELSYFPDYSDRLRSLATHQDTKLRGGFDNTRIADVLCSIDVLVVPSIWFENSPLTIHEAYAAKVPVIATDLGGMKDLVTPGVTGLLFERGNPDDLARAMRRIVEEPGLLGRLRAGLPALKTMDEDAAGMETHYERLLEKRAPSRSRSVRLTTSAARSFETPASGLEAPASKVSV